MRIPGMTTNDVAQEVRCVVLEHQMYGIDDEEQLYYHARDHLHKLRRRTTPEQLDCDIAIDDAPLYDCLDAFMGLLESVRDELTETQYKILVLTYLDDVPDSQIAEQLGLRVRTMQARRSEALKKFRENL